MSPQVLRWVLPEALTRFKAAVDARRWTTALVCAGPGHMLSLCLDLIRAGLVPGRDLPAVIGVAVAHSDGDGRLTELLVNLRARGQRIFDGDRRSWEKTFASLPERLTIYRGVSEAERGPDYGVSWTLFRPRAIARIRELGTARPLLLIATVDKSDICGLLTERFESEVLALSADLKDVRRVPLEAPCDEGTCLKPRDRAEWADWVARMGATEISRRAGVALPDVLSVFQ